MHPGAKAAKDYKSLVDPLLNVCVLQNKINSGLHPRIKGSRGTRVWPIHSYCDHANACCRISQSTQVACRLHKGLAHQMLLRAHTHMCVAE